MKFIVLDEPTKGAWISHVIPVDNGHTGPVVFRISLPATDHPERVRLVPGPDADNQDWNGSLTGTGAEYAIRSS